MLTLNLEVCVSAITELPQLTEWTWLNCVQILKQRRGWSIINTPSLVSQLWFDSVGALAHHTSKIVLKSYGILLP